MRIGVIGLGFGAHVHVPAFSALPGVDVVALADGGSGRVRAFGRDHLPAARVYDDPYALLADATINAVSIAVPPTAQAALISAALDAGKDVLCEKPVAGDAETCAALARRARAAGRVAAVGFQFRFEPGLTALIGAARQGLCGTIERIAVTWLGGHGRAQRLPFTWRCQRSGGGGVLREYGSHCFDYIARISGGAPEVISARLAVRVAMRGAPALPVSAEDECDVLCRLPAGGVATIAISNVYPLPTGHRVEVHGIEGVLGFEHRAPFDRYKAKAWFTDRTGKTQDLMEPAELGAVADSRLAAWGSLAARFVSTIRDPTQPATDLPMLEDAVAAWRVIEAVERLCPPPWQRDA